MNILFDTNVILDLMLDRKPHSVEAELLFTCVESLQIEGTMCATTVTTLDYLLSKALTKKKSTQSLKNLLMLFDIAAVNRLVLEEALSSNFSDFEDAVLHSAALHAGIHGIVTRNEKDFHYASISIYSPRSLLNALSLKQ